MSLLLPADPGLKLLNLGLGRSLVERTLLILDLAERTILILELGDEL